MKIQKSGNIGLAGWRVLRHWLARAGLLVLITLLLALPVLASSSPGYNLSRQVIAAASGAPQSPAYHLLGSLGQAPVGMSTSGANQLCSGFHCSGAVYSRLYLPFLKK
jgi:hypothetical protein